MLRIAGVAAILGIWATIQGTGVAADQGWLTLQDDAAIKFAGDMAKELDKAKSTEPAAARVAMLRGLAEEVRSRFPNNIILGKQLGSALESGDAATLERAVSQAINTLQFRARQEAELPANFPPPTPVGEIRLKEYPAYRLARTSSKNDSAFFTLFAHITTNRIEMTAPVEMNYQTNKAKQDPQQVDMAFLYGKPTIGKPGKTLLGVSVQDIPARTTVSLGLKGDTEREKLAEHEQALEAWLAKEAPAYERDGLLRVMGYNSPQVPAEQRYYEIELPVRKKKDS